MEIIKNIEKERDYIIYLQKELTKRPAISPLSGGDGEYEKAMFIVEELKKYKFDKIEVINAKDEKAKNSVRPNIVAIYNGINTSKTVWFMSHMDVVPPGELSLWNSDPYKLVVDGDKLIGRGVEDNQQAIVSSILVVKTLIENNIRLNFNIGLLFCADEETGSGFGADYIVKHRKDLFGEHDMFFVPDSGVEDGSKIEIAEKSILWMKVKTVGKQCHASRPQLGINSFKAASHFVCMLDELYKKFNKKDKLYQPPISTFEPTKKEANVPNVNTIPGEDVFYIDMRVLPQYKLEEVEKKLKGIAKIIEKKFRVKISFEYIQKSQAAPPTDPNSEIVVALKRAIEEVLKVRPSVYGIGGGTVAAYFRRLGLPTVVYSKLNESAHQPNEFCYVSNVIDDAKVFLKTLFILNGMK
ncbi:MAG: M20 family metallo-hydrolase [Elusimicrobiales bacterium]|nr:M20 family metallo-hydrolase [Elusimicrobiales bacterium]